MTANAAIFTIVNKFPKNGKIFTIMKILFRTPKVVRKQKALWRRQSKSSYFIYIPKG